MKVFLHIGSHKTATTAIQYFARRNKDWLLDRGLLYPSLDLVGERPQQSHLGVMSGLFRLGERHAVNPEIGRELLVKSAEIAQARNLDILLSAENLFRLQSEVREEAFELFRSIYTDFDIVVVAGLRRQDNLADSLYKSITKVNRRQLPFPEFLESRRGVFSYADIMGQVETYYSQRPRLLPYTREGNKAFLPQFFNELGVDVTDAPAAVSRQNASYDLVDCLVKVALFDLRVHQEVLEGFDGFVQRNPVRTDYTFFTEASRREFMAEYAPQNAELLTRYPELAPALGDNTPADVNEPVDDACRSMVARRLTEYREFYVRTAR